MISLTKTTNELKEDIFGVDAGFLFKIQLILKEIYDKLDELDKRMGALEKI